MSKHERIPDEAVEAAARAMEPAVWGPQVWTFVAHGETPTAARDRVRRESLVAARLILEAAAPYMTGDPLMHAYAALGYTVCGLDTGGAISRGEGYEGPSHRSTIDAEHVTCEACRA